MTHDYLPTLYTAQDFQGRTCTGQLLVASPMKVPNRTNYKPSYWLILSVHANGGWLAVGNRVRVKPETLKLLRS